MDTGNGQTRPIADSGSPGGAVPFFSKDKLSVSVAALLISASLLSWLGVLYAMPMMTSSGVMGVASLVPSVSPSAISLFELLWVLGMVAMMFPAMIPIVIFYNRFSTKVEPNPTLARLVGTPFFLAGYLAVYAGLGLAVYCAVFLAVSVSSAMPGLAAPFSAAPGAILVFAGVYQLSPRKSNFLMHCVSPMGFFTKHSQRRGVLGSLRMGVSHGEYCVGCCWAYMLVMFAVALMSLPFMAVLSVVIALEKVFLRGAIWFTRAIAAALVILGVVSIVFPGVLALLSAGV